MANQSKDTAKPKVARLIQLLAEQQLSGFEIAETLWLAAQMEPEEAFDFETKSESSSTASSLMPHKSAVPQSSSQPTPAESRANLTTAPMAGALPVNALPVWVSDPSILDKPLEIIRALRPLISQVEIGIGERLDEAATVDGIARHQMCLPVMEAETEPWFDVILVIDCGSSMSIWQRLIVDLEKILRRYGTFRDLRVFDIDIQSEGVSRVEPLAERQTVRLKTHSRRSQQWGHVPSELIEQRGRRIVIILSDCVGAYWWDGTLLPMLSGWASAMPTVVWQVLPNWMWERTALGRGRAISLSNDVAGAPNNRLQRIARGRQMLSPREQELLPIPVVTSEPVSLNNWSLMLSGHQHEQTPGFVLPPSGGIAPREDLNAALTEEDVDPVTVATEKMQRFLQLSSSTAQQLIMLLAAAPVITLPVMRLIRDAMLSSDKSPLPVAEVFLSGLLRRIPEQELGTSKEKSQIDDLGPSAEDPLDADIVQYNFLPGIREALLKRLPAVKTLEVLNKVSTAVENRWSAITSQDFRAFLTDPSIPVPEGLKAMRAFGTVSAEILETLGGDYAKLASQLKQTSRTEVTYNLKAENSHRILLASSSGLKEDLDQFEIFISRKNSEWLDRNITLEVVRWEGFLDSMSTEGLQNEYNKAVEDCDIFVMLVHNKVGKYTAEEFSRAFGQFSKERRPLIYTYCKPSTTRNRDDLQSLWAFEDKLKELKHYLTEYTSIEGLREHFGNQLNKLDAEGFMTAEPLGRRSQPKGVIDPYRVPLQMPPLPDHFVERPESQDAVKKQLLCEDKVGTLVVSAIYGLGGIGKSVLAAKLAHDPEVRDYFVDGILWVTLGQNPDILPLLSGWIQSLGDHDFKPTAVESASNHLRTLLYDKCILLVVDDVWNPVHLEPFRVEGDKGRVLVTTREARIEGARLHSLDVMDEGQALALMTQKISDSLSEEAREQAATFARRVGYLPLALELAASQIEDGVSWTELLADFTNEVTRLESLDMFVQAEMPDDEKRRKYSLLACFNLSFKQLSPEQLHWFAWLGVVPEDVSLTQEMVETLWDVTARQAGAILRVFRAKSLVLQGVRQAGERSSYRMHDLMHDLAQKLLQLPLEPEQEGALPGLGLTMEQAHGEVLARYYKRIENDQWHTLRPDGYIHSHLTWHMVQANRSNEVHQLLKETTTNGRNGWFSACSSIGLPSIFSSDLSRALQLASEMKEQNPKQAQELERYYYSLRQRLQEFASSIPPQLLSELVKQKSWSIQQAINHVRLISDESLFIESIQALLPHLLNSILPEVLKLSKAIQDESLRAEALTILSSRFPSLVSEALKAINQIRNLSIRGELLVKLASQSTELLPEALEIVRQIDGEAVRGGLLAQLASQSSELLPEALEIVRQIKNHAIRGELLAQLASQSSELLPEALEVARQIDGEAVRGGLLAQLASQSQELLPQALEAISQIKNHAIRGELLAQLASQSSELLPEALEVVRQIDDEAIGGKLLAQLASQSSELLPEALEVVRQIDNEVIRGQLLAQLVSQSPELLSEALETSRQQF